MDAGGSFLAFVPGRSAEATRPDGVFLAAVKSDRHVRHADRARSAQAVSVRKTNAAMIFHVPVLALNICSRCSKDGILAPKAASEFVLTILVLLEMWVERTRITLPS